MAVQARRAVPPITSAKRVWRPTGSLSRRITRLVVLTAFLAALVGVGPALWQAYAGSRAAILQQTQDALDTNRSIAIAALDVGDKGGARLVAERIATAAGASSVRIFDLNGALAAEFTPPAAAPAAPSPKLPRWQRVLAQYLPTLPVPDLKLARRLDINGDPVGSIDISVSQRPVVDAVLEQLNPAMLTILLAVGLALLIAARLRRQIARPVCHLLEMMDQVAHSQNYSVRATPHGPDEIGSLIVSFNQMLHQVHTRNLRLAEHRKKLQELVIERTRNFEQAAKEAEKASRAKGDFLARMSHEIRTPMNGVVGMAELLENTRLEEQQHRMLHTMRSSADSLLDIINDILDFSRIEAGQLQVLETEFCLIDVIEEVCELLASKAHERNLELVCDIDAQVPTICAGDPIRLRQIVTNLLGNAVKYTEKGQVILRTTASKGAQGRFELRVEVEDTGLGIPENQLGVIFDAFTQGDSFETRKHGGTGLGLAITKQLVTLLGGDIGITSTVGVGTKVWMTLPLAVPAEPKQAPEAPWKTRVKSVLVVQDNEAAAKAVAAVLETAGARVWTARTGHRAMECTAIDNFDLALIDELLPDMAGVELLDRLRSSPATANVPVVLMTSTKPAAAALSAIEHSSEPDSTFGKPLRRARLREAVDRALGSGDSAVGRAAAANKPKLGLRVLLVEDSPVNLEVAVGMLEAVGCKVDTASDGALGVEQALSWNFDVILMDCQMPLMDGFEATRRIRMAEVAAGRQSLPIIALTANALQGDRERCLAAGMSDFISKPFTMAKLHSTLKAAMRSRAAPVAEQAAEDPEPTVNEALRPDAGGDALPVIDPAQLAELRSLGRPQVLVQATELFKKQAAQKLEDLDGALQRSDATAVEQAAHALKSSALSIGGRRFAAAASDCEMAARKSDLETACRYPGTLRSEFAQLCEALVAAAKAEERAA